MHVHITLFISWFHEPISGAQLSDNENPNTAKIRHLISVTYQGRSYIMVENLTLPFDEAEEYCRKEFSEPMHLVSVHSDAEWEMLNNAFGRTYPSEIWLGATIRHPKSKVFVLMWNDMTPVDYHRFSITEQQRWVANWRVHSHGCILANVERSRYGNWSAEFAPCVSTRAFICQKPSTSAADRSTHIRIMANRFSPFRRDRSLLDELFGPILFSPHPQMSAIGSFEFIPVHRHASRFPATDKHLEAGHHTTRRLPSEHVTGSSPKPTEPMSMTTATNTETTPAEPIINNTPSLHTEGLPVRSHLSTENETISANSTGKPGTILHQPNGLTDSATRIIRTIPEPKQQDGTLLTGTPKFRVVARNSRPQAAPSVVRMPILKSNAQYIYPKTIWDLA